MSIRYRSPCSTATISTEIARCDRPCVAPNCSIHVVLADGANAGRLRPLVANRLGETHLLPRFQVVFAYCDEVDLPSSAEAMNPWSLSG